MQIFNQEEIVKRIFEKLFIKKFACNHSVIIVVVIIIKMVCAKYLKIMISIEQWHSSS